MVRSVDPEGPSAKAGIKPGDIVIDFDGKQIGRVSDLPRTVGSTKPGTKATVRIWRSGKEKKLTVIVEELLSATAVASNNTIPSPKNKPQATVFNWLGLSVAELPKEIAQKLSIDGGVVISSSEGVSRGAGLLTGDVITSVNNKNVVSVSQFRTAVSNSKKGKVLVFLVRRGAEAMFVPIKP